MSQNRMGFLLSAILIATQFSAAVKANAGPEMTPVDEEIAARMPRATSFGAPDSLEAILFQDEYFAFETPADSAKGNISQWSDEQILRHYQAEIDRTNSWLDQVIAKPSTIVRLNEDLEIARRSSRPQRARMSGLTCLAIAIQGEAGGEPAAGKAAVAQTIMTRAGGNASRVCSVIFARSQFEAMTKRARKPSAETIRIAQAAIRSGKKCGFDHFINKSLQRHLGRSIPSWVFRFERRGCFHKKIGQQDYYSSCNCKN